MIREEIRRGPLTGLYYCWDGVRTVAIRATPDGTNLSSFPVEPTGRRVRATVKEFEAAVYRCEADYALSKGEAR